MVMKKNISINISGIIFHIEEDGYQKLKTYLDSINKYFSSYDDSEEIIADIESRIAEIFLEKLETDNKQVISNADIDRLVTTMGEISDFEAMEEETVFGDEQKSTQQSTSKSKREGKSDTSDKKLYRDLNQQVLGGVGSGIAHYFNLDPVWIRIAFIVLLGTGFGLLGYIILWIVVPGSHELEVDDSIKKFYRDPDDRVLGGVASGLANYFRTDAIVFRIIFIVLTFGGVGIIGYIVLWIIGPQANSLTDKMQMKGEKVTLSNIDSNIKRSKDEDLNPRGEGTFTKIILFPFRLIGKILRGIGSALGPLFLFIAAAFRVFIGAMISLVGISVMFSLLVAAGVLLGLHDGDWFYWSDSDFPIELFYNTVPELGILFVFAAVFIPFLYVFIAGVTIIAKRKVMSSSVGWSILGIWMISVLGTFATVPNVIRDFRDEGYHDTTDIVEVEADTVTLSLKEYEYQSERRSRRNSFRDDYTVGRGYESEFTDLDIRASDDNTWKLEKRATARGRNPEEADENAEAITYNYSVNGDEIVFDRGLTFDRGSQFRFQDLDMTLYIPVNQPFKVDRDMDGLLRYFSYRYRWWEVYRNTWIFNDEGVIECLTCDEEVSDNSTSYNSNETKVLDLDNFSDISISASIQANISYGQEFQVRMEGNTTDFDEVKVEVLGRRLRIDPTSGSTNWSTTTVFIQLPELDKVTFSESSDIQLNTSNFANIDITTRENARLNLTGSLEQAKFTISDDSRVDSEAEIADVDMTISNSGRFYGYDGEMRECIVSTSSEARARLNVRDYIEVEANGFSSIRYKGSPREIIKDKSNSAIVSQY